MPTADEAKQPMTDDELTAIRERTEDWAHAWAATTNGTNDGDHRTLDSRALLAEVDRLRVIAKAAAVVAAHYNEGYVRTIELEALYGATRGVVAFDTSPAPGDG